MTHFRGLKDSSIPTSMEKLEEESETYQGNFVGIPRADFLVHIRDIVNNSSNISLQDLQGMSSDEIYDLLSLVSTELGTGISDLVEILRGARKEFKHMILFKVLSLTEEDMRQ